MEVQSIAQTFLHLLHPMLRSHHLSSQPDLPPYLLHQILTQLYNLLLILHQHPQNLSSQPEPPSNHKDLLQI